MVSGLEASSGGIDCLGELGYESLKFAALNVSLHDVVDTADRKTERIDHAVFVSCRDRVKTLICP